MSVYVFRGFGVGLGLIVAIGAQNAFLLARAVRGDRTVLVAAICAICDVAWIGLAVTGAGAALAAHSTVAEAASWGGVAFLIIYGARAFRTGRTANRGLSTTGDPRTTSARTTVLATLAVSLLNPHAFLDAFVLIAGVTAPLDPAARHAFGVGACLASVCWFATLAVAGRRLAPAFRSPATWRKLDIAVGATMWLIAAMILRDLLA